MKTVIIYDDCEANLRFFLVEGDLSHLDGKYVNGDATQTEADEIMKHTLDPETGHCLPHLEHFPVAELFSVVIVCGFIP